MSATFIRKPNQHIALNDAQLIEMAKIFKRPKGIKRFVYYVDIQTDKGPLNFGKVIKHYQWPMIDLMQGNERAILLASRQMSKTTIAAFYLLYEACFPVSQGDILIVAHKLSHATEVLRRMKQMYYSIPLWMKPGVIKNNEGSMEFDNGMRVFAEATTGNAARGKSIKIAYCVDGATEITIRNKYDNHIKTININALLSNEYQ